MRLSIKPKDPGWNPRLSKHCEVYLDGIKVDLCHTADEDKGYVVMYKKDKNGLIIHDFYEATSFKKDGDVEIKLKKWGKNGFKRIIKKRKGTAGRVDSV